MIYPLFIGLGLALLCISCSDSSAEEPRVEKARKNTSTALRERLESKSLALGSPVFIRAFKEENILEVFVQDVETEQFKLFRTYRIAAASGSLGPKLAEGDRQVPEGFYFVPPSAMNPKSRYHLAFNIGFPNEFDRSHGRTGSFIMIHGGRASIGCLAMTDPIIEEIYTLCTAAHASGQPFFRVHIFPFRMNAERMRKSADSPWFDFWKNLKVGYDYFERNKVPPDVTVSEKEYVFR